MARPPRPVLFDLQDKDGVMRKIPFPQGNYSLIKGLVSYSADGLATIHSSAFRHDRKFIDSYQVGVNTTNPRMKIFWRMHIIFWAAQNGLHLNGDFVECGVNRGIYSSALMNYVDFEKQTGRKFYLFDTFEGIPLEDLTSDEIERQIPEYNKIYNDSHQDAVKTFSKYDNVRIIKGKVPESFRDAQIERVAYLSIDMNHAKAEMAAAEFFWDRLVPGAVVVLDDYGFTQHEGQKRSWDKFAADHGFAILSSPTGQGVWIKPPPLQQNEPPAK